METFAKNSADSIDEVVGNQDAVASLKKFSADIERGARRKPLMIYGPPGTGKTLAAHLLAKSVGWNTIEMNAGDYRDRTSVERMLRVPAKTRSLFGSRNLILFDEIDDLSGRFDSGASGAISSLIDESKNPMIFIANDMWDQGISFLRGKTDPVEFRKLRSDDIFSILSNLLKRNGEKMDKRIVEMVANRAAGDARSAMNDLFVMLGAGEETIDSLGLRDRKSDVFVALDKIFMSHTLSAPLRAVANTDVDNDMMIKWIDENIPYRYVDIADLHLAYVSLSGATSFASRASRSQYYTYWRYMSALMSSGVALSKSRSPSTSRRYSFPKVISSLSASKAGRQGDVAIARKLQREIHLSISKIRSSVMGLIAEEVRNALRGGVADKEQVYDFFMGRFGISDKEVDSLIERQWTRQAL